MKRDTTQHLSQDILVKGDGLVFSGWDAENFTQLAWIPSTRTWSYLSSDSPSFVVSVNGIVTGTIGVGDKIKLSHLGSNKYFIVTAESVTGSTSYMNLYGGTDYSLTTGAISSVYFSHAKSPQGFPLSPDKWTYQVTDTTQRTQNPVTATTWYNLGSVSANIPIGTWRLGYSLDAAGVYLASPGQISVFTTLSTSSSSESDATLTRKINSSSALLQFESSMQAERIQSLSAKTIYYILTKSNQAVDYLYNQNAQQTLIIYAECAFL